MGTGFAAENAEFVLQAHDVEAAVIQEVCCTHVFFNVVIVDLQSDRRGVIVGLAAIGHCHDGGLKVRW